MRYVVANMIDESMKTGEAIYQSGTKNGVPLLTNGVVISPKIRERLLQSGVTGLLVEDQISNGIAVEPLISADLHRSLSTEMTRLASMVRDDHSRFTATDLEPLNALVFDLVDELSPKEVICMTRAIGFCRSETERAIATSLIAAVTSLRYLTEHGWVDHNGMPRMDRRDERTSKLVLGTLLMDFGLMLIPRMMRQLSGGYLADASVKDHVRLSLSLIERADISPLTRAVISGHHERWDGSGYPKGISGAPLHLNAQIAGAADQLVAMHFRGSDHLIDPFAARREFESSAMHTMNPVVARALLESTTPAGAGVTVLMNDGRAAIVVRTLGGTESIVRFLDTAEDVSTESGARIVRVSNHSTIARQSNAA